MLDFILDIVNAVLDFINNNPVLASGLFGLLTAIISSSITALVTIKIENKKAEQSKVAKLEEKLEATTTELNEVKKQLALYTNLQEAEKSIVKGNGSVYQEKLADGSNRYICGYCWETEHLRIPIAVRRDSSIGLNGHCGHCKARCQEKRENEYRSVFNGTPVI